MVSQSNENIVMLPWLFHVEGKGGFRSLSPLNLKFLGTKLPVWNKHFGWIGTDLMKQSITLYLLALWHSHGHLPRFLSGKSC